MSQNRLTLAIDIDFAARTLGVRDGKGKAAGAIPYPIDHKLRIVGNCQVQQIAR
jgi:hypothetical protein